MCDNQNFHILNKHREHLSTSLDLFVANLVTSFSQDSLLSESELAAIEKLDLQKPKINHLLDIIINKVKDGSDRCFNKLIAFMRNSQDSNLLELANKMTATQQDNDDIPCRQPVETESGSSSPQALVQCEEHQRQRKSIYVSLQRHTYVVGIAYYAYASGYMCAHVHTYIYIYICIQAYICDHTADAFVYVSHECFGYL